MKNARSDSSDGMPGGEGLSGPGSENESIMNSLTECEQLIIKLKLQNQMLLKQNQALGEKCSSLEELIEKQAKETESLRTLGETLRSSESEMNRQKNLLQTTLEILPVGVWILDEGGKVIGANNKAREIWGGAKFVGPDKYKTYKAWDYLSGEELSMERRASARAMKGLSTYQDPIRIETFDEKIKIILNSAVPICGSEGQIEGAVIVNQDVTELMQVSEKLRVSEERFRLLFESMSEGFFIGDLIYDENQEVVDYRYEELNEAYARMVNVNIDEIKGRRFREIFPDYSPPWMQLLRQLDSKGEPIHTEVYSGRFEKHFEVFAYSTKKGQIAILITDRTEKRLAEDALKNAHEKLKFHIENSPLAFIEFDSTYKITAWSKNAENLFGWKAEEVLGKRIGEFRWVHEDDAEKVAELSRHMLASHKTSNVHTNRNYRKDGAVVICEWYNSALVDDAGNMISVQSMVLDITDRKKYEDELNRALAALKRSNADLEQFAYVASHDLQEPLRMVTSYTQLLAKRYMGRLDKNANEFIEFALDGAKRMQILIRDLLEFSRISTKKDAKEKVDLNALLGDVLSDLKITLKKARARVTVDGMPIVEADPSQIRQLFQNLISNAIKFRKKTSPEISISAERKGREWEFSVCDNGIGIDPDQLERIFVIFQRLHTSDEYPGTGIGLAVCKKIVERHGGRIWVESVPGDGSVFHFTLPG